MKNGGRSTTHRTRQHYLYLSIKQYQSIIVLVTIACTIRQFLYFSKVSERLSLVANEDQQQTIYNIISTSTSPSLSPPTFPIEQKRTSNGPTTPGDEITIDMISIGSINRNEYQNQQVRTFGNHKSIRNFYRINEYNDTSENQCSQKLSVEQVNDIKKFCNTKWDTDGSTIRTWLRNRLKPYQKSTNGSENWICAQKRPIDALQVVLDQYRTDHTIPDFIVLIDDDTYIHMDHLAGVLYNYTKRRMEYNINDNNNDNNDDSESNLLVLSGCVTNFPYQLQFKFPNVGYGSILSKAVIQNLLRPIICNSNHHLDTDNVVNYTILDPFTRMACWRLYEQNHFNELQYFVDGMSVSDLMYNYTKSLSFLHVDTWENGDGFCFQSEHALAYFLGFFHVAIPDHILLNADMSDDVRKENIYGYSEIAATIGVDNMDNISTTTTAINSQCTNSNYESCNRNDIICRNIQPHQMELMFFNDIYFEDEFNMKLQLLQLQQHNESISFDVISIGSLTKPHLQPAQKGTFGSHSSIRHWFQINELNDTDASCSTDLSMDQITTVINKCKHVTKDDSRFSRIMRKYVFRPRKHKGWLCAQKRPIDGLFKALQTYKVVDDSDKGSENTTDKQTSLSLPNYLAIIDDDTYLNMHYLSDALPINYPSYESYVVTGCPLSYPKSFTFPYGGFGTILSRRAIENLLRPIYCSSNEDTAHKADSSNNMFNAMACWRLKENLFGEQSFFEDGMSVSDLMYAYSSALLFTKVDEWNNTLGFCFHSDHALAYFLGFYHVPVTDEKWLSIDYEMKSDPTKRFDAYLNDKLRKEFQYTGLHRNGIDGCTYSKRGCTIDAPVCHYVVPNRMFKLHSLSNSMQ